MLTSGHDAQFIFNDVVWLFFAKHFWLSLFNHGICNGTYQFYSIGKGSVFSLQ
jgi:hypothetical protein